MLANSRTRAARVQGLGETVEAIEEFARRSEDLSSRLHHEVLASRMRPLADGIAASPGWFAMSPAARQAGDSRSSARPRASTATSSTGSRRRSTI